MPQQFPRSPGLTSLGNSPPFCRICRERALEAPLRFLRGQTLQKTALTSLLLISAHVQHRVNYHPPGGFNGLKVAKKCTINSKSFFKNQHAAASFPAAMATARQSQPPLQEHEPTMQKYESLQLGCLWSVKGSRFIL